MDNDSCETHLYGDSVITCVRMCIRVRMYTCIRICVATYRGQFTSGTKSSI